MGVTVGSWATGHRSFGRVMGQARSASVPWPAMSFVPGGRQDVGGM